MWGVKLGVIFSTDQLVTNLPKSWVLKPSRYWDFCPICQYMAMSFFDWTMGDQWKVTLREHWSSVRLYPQLFSGGRMSYLRYLCLFAYCGVQHILCYVFVLLFFVLCDMCYQFLWIVHFDCPFGPTRDVGVSLNIKIKYKTKPTLF
jgi:hypothetical protein